MSIKRPVRRLYRWLWHAAAGASALAQLPRSRRRRTPDGPAPRRILVVRLGLLGDGVLLTPALRLLRQSFPGARIDVLATPIQRPVFESHPAVDRVVVWTAGDLLEPRLALQPHRWTEAKATIRQLRRERYDLALSCYGHLGSWIVLAAGARRRVGFAGEALAGTLTRALPGRRYEHPIHEAEYNVEVARAGGATGDAPSTELVVTEDARQAAAALLPGAPGGAIVVHTGATNGSAKRWPIEHWAALTRRLLDGGATVALVGHGREDEALSRRLHALVGSRRARPGRLVDLVGRTSTGELFAVLERAGVLVTGDSGPMHVAVALRRPVVAIFGPTDPHQSGPFRPEVAVVVRHQLPCSPCYRLDRVAECPLGHTLCQRLIDPESVYGAIGRALDGAARAAAAN